jgi:glycerol kinase
MTVPANVLAIDAGTTGVTALVVDERGSVVAKGYQEFAQHFPQPGWVEHAPEEIWQATLEATRSALAQVDQGDLRCCGTARRWVRPDAPSSGRTGARRTSATGCAATGTRTGSRT